MNQQDKNQEGRNQDSNQDDQRNQDQKMKNQTTRVEDEQGPLTAEDLPDATNESTGKMGSGQRQDSN